LRAALPVDAARLDLRSPAALDRIVETDDDRPVPDKGGDQQVQQPMGYASGRPACRAQHAMINGEARALVQDAQRRTHGAPARAQQGSSNQHQVAPVKQRTTGHIQSARLRGTVPTLIQGPIPPVEPGTATRFGRGDHDDGDQNRRPA
jgi:hypothetical protein